MSTLPVVLALPALPALLDLLELLFELEEPDWALATAASSVVTLS
jgi:hypothetical protein